jgi:zinc/manganese transport system substrate-binding protein/manganese/iron transport system substrate-binding protein
MTVRGSREKKRWILVAAAALALAAPAAAVGGSRVTVVATTTQLQDLVRNVGGARVDVVGILKPNVDPHDYEPTPSDVAAIGDAKLIVESGAGLDSWIDQVIANAGSKAPAVVASDGLRLRTGDGQEPQRDPHWWHDPRNFEHATALVASRLEQVDPGGRSLYAANARRYIAQIEAVDRANLRLIARVPRAQRKLVTNHDAFGYLAARYGITIVGSVIPSLSTAAEPNARDTVRLLERIREQHVKAIFTESSLDPKLEDQIGRDAHVKVYADLYGDTLGPAGSPGATYLGMERWNVRALVAGFLGQPQPGE